MPIDREKEGVAEAEKAKAGLRQGIERSKALLRQYRARLSILRRTAPASTGDRPLFRFES